MRDEVLVQSRSELDMVLVNVETAVRLKQRPDFFSWVQGVFQGMLPHEVLICGLADASTRSLHYEWMGSYPCAAERLAELCNPNGGLMPMLVTRWDYSGRMPLVVTAELNRDSAGFEAIGDALRRLDLTNVAAHGLQGVDGYPVGFFAFFKISTVLSRASAVVELLLPYLYAAWLRVNCEQVGERANRTSPGREILTVREIEILDWVERGKSNNEIARILSISHLTVKNHVQKILRKLNVQNRTQAVARGYR
jgi:transcriptional regulator EpsA